MFLSSVFFFLLQDYRLIAALYYFYIISLLFYDLFYDVFYDLFHCVIWWLAKVTCRKNGFGTFPFELCLSVSEVNFKLQTKWLRLREMCFPPQKKTLKFSILIHSRPMAQENQKFQPKFRTF